MYMMAKKIKSMNHRPRRFKMTGKLALQKSQHLMKT
jgi:hypothetical protein